MRRSFEILSEKLTANNRRRADEGEDVGRKGFAVQRKMRFRLFLSASELEADEHIIDEK